MRQVIVCLVLFLGSVDRCRSTYFQEEDGVLVLNESNFDDALSEFPELFVKFYSPKCGHCTKVAPVYVDTARALKEAKSRVRLAKVEATVHKSLRDKYKIKGFPTFLLFLSGLSEPLEYDLYRDRTVDNFLLWLSKRTGNPSKTVQDVQFAKRLIHQNDRVALGFFKDRSSSAAKAFLEVASRNDDYVFGFVTAREVFNEFRASVDSIVVFKQFDEGRVDMKEKLEVESIKNFLRKHQYPLVNNVKDGLLYMLYTPDMAYDKFLLLFADKSSTDFEKTINKLRPVASAIKGAVITAYVDVSSEDNSWLMDRYGVAMDECPAVLYVDTKENRKFKYVVDPNDDKTSFHWLNLQQFVKDCQYGILKPFLKSQPLPNDWNSGPVKVLVQSNFEDVALDSKKNVFVEFYAPWCGACKKLAPVWDELAEHFKGVADLVIAKIDATANEIEGHSIQSFPTLKYFPRNGAPVVQYKGNLTLPELANFINNGGKNIELPVSTENKAEGKKTEL